MARQIVIEDDSLIVPGLLEKLVDCGFSDVVAVQNMKSLHNAATDIVQEALLLI